jgi:hypothetical protein
MRRLAVTLVLGISVLIVVLPPSALAGDGPDVAQSAPDDGSTGLLDIVLRELQTIVGLGGTNSDDAWPSIYDNGWDIHPTGGGDTSSDPSSEPWLDGFAVDSASVSDDNGWDEGITTWEDMGNVGSEATGVGGPW